MKKIKVRFKTNAWGNTSAYIGSRRVRQFGEDTFGAGWWASCVAAKGHAVKFSSDLSFVRGFDSQRKAIRELHEELVDKSMGVKSKLEWYLSASKGNTKSPKYRQLETEVEEMNQRVADSFMNLLKYRSTFSQLDSKISSQ